MGSVVGFKSHCMCFESSSDSIKNALEIGGLLEAIDAPFYDLVARIGRDLVGSPNDHAKSNTLLAQHTHFMSHLDEIHHNFESGYQYLIQLRRNLR
jgi:hypothetical protein